MSFSFGFQTRAGDTDTDFDAAVAGQIANATEHNYEPNVAKAVELGMIDAAKAYVAVVAEAVAGGADTLAVSVSGHANPGKEAVAGWAANTITVSITQVYAAASA